MICFEVDYSQGRTSSGNGFEAAPSEAAVFFYSKYVVLR